LLHGPAIKNDKDELALFMLNQTGKTRAGCICYSSLDTFVKAGFFLNKQMSIFPENLLCKQFILTFVP
jgi:hypothetical protein